MEYLPSASDSMSVVDGASGNSAKGSRRPVFTFCILQLTVTHVKDAVTQVAVTVRRHYLVSMESIGLMPARFCLDRLLTAAGMSQRELARQSGVSPTTVNRMVANLTAQVSLRTLDALAKVLRVEPGYIIETAQRGRTRAKS